MYYATINIGLACFAGSRKVFKQKQPTPGEFYLLLQHGYISALHSLYKPNTSSIQFLVHWKMHPGIQVIYDVASMHTAVCSDLCQSGAKKKPTCTLGF
jgi:hypothetical protein